MKQSLLLWSLATALSAQVAGPSFHIGVQATAGAQAQDLRPGFLLGFAYQVPLDSRFALKADLSAGFQPLSDEACRHLGVKEARQNTLALSPLLAWESADRGSGSWRIFAGPGIVWADLSRSEVIGVTPGGPEGVHVQSHTLSSRRRGQVVAGVGHVWPGGKLTYATELRVQRMIGPEAPATTLGAVFSVGF